MILLTLFAFAGGFVTILSPCILPILPLVLSGGIAGGKYKPYGVVVGFVASFSFFTLSLATLVKYTGASPDILRSTSVIIIFALGAALVIPKLQQAFESIASKLISRFASSQSKSGFSGGVLLGLSLGLVWTPCVGPIIASVITLAATSTVNASAVILTVAYSLGTAIPMLAIIVLGRGALTKYSFLSSRTAMIQKIFGIIMMIVALSIFFNVDRKFQSWVLEVFPNYGTGLTAFEDNEVIQGNLEKLTGRSEKSMRDDVREVQNQFSAYPQAPEIIAGGEWLNTKTPLSIEALKGKVVLIDFWTYTCINCIRTLPYLKQWHKSYESQGLVIIGVHTPEFAFEREKTNVEAFLKEQGITYPIVQDNDYATWNAYENRYWPAKYLIDATGKIRYTHFGEGDYAETEKKIQELLREKGENVTRTVTGDIDSSRGTQSPETYLGSRRLERYVGSVAIAPNVQTDYRIADTIRRDEFAFSGPWTVYDEYAKPEQGSELVMRFAGSQVFLVMNTPEVSAPVRVRVMLDGSPISKISAGKDVADGFVSVDSNRLYDLVNLTEAGVHVLTLSFPDIQTPELYAFTFGTK